MKQHNSFKTDMDLISEAAMGVLGGAHMMHNVAGDAADSLAQDDGFENAEDAENKTGDMSDAELLKKCCEPDGSLKPEDGEHHGAPTPVSPEDEAYM